MPVGSVSTIGTDVPTWWTLDGDQNPTAITSYVHACLGSSWITSMSLTDKAWLGHCFPHKLGTTVSCGQFWISVLHNCLGCQCSYPEKPSLPSYTHRPEREESEGHLLKHKTMQSYKVFMALREQGQNGSRDRIEGVVSEVLGWELLEVQVVLMRT